MCLDCGASHWRRLVALVDTLQMYCCWLQHPAKTPVRCSSLCSHGIFSSVVIIRLVMQSLYLGAGPPARALALLAASGNSVHRLVADRGVKAGASCWNFAPFKLTCKAYHFSVLCFDEVTRNQRRRQLLAERGTPAACTTDRRRGAGSNVCDAQRFSWKLLGGCAFRLGGTVSRVKAEEISEIRPGACVLYRPLLLMHYSYNICSTKLP